jgi:hypothetical protein
VAALKFISKEVSEALNSYMSVLSHIGYKSYCSVEKLLVYTFIEEILDICKTAVTEEDYNTLSNVVNCLYGSCMIPFPYYLEHNNQGLPTVFYSMTVE